MIKSPLNYIGGKYRLLPQIFPFFPKQINVFVDLFAGGLDVSLNIQASRIISNDINYYVIDLLKFFQQKNIEVLINDVGKVIKDFGLTKQNSEGYYALRKEYNNTRSPLHLFLLVCFGFNHQFRFNGNGEFNNPFGINRSSYNENTEKNLRQMHQKLQKIELHSSNFKDFPLDFMRQGDFLYADPPYLISCGSYNDGKRGFEGWNKNDDLLLFDTLDRLNDRGIQFAMSNVIKHKGNKNEPLLEWSAKYHTHHIHANYSNSNYQASAGNTIEVLITNY